MSFFTMEDPAPFSPNLWVFEVRMNVEWTLHYNRVWRLATRLVEGWIGIYHSWPRRNNYDFHSSPFLFVLTYFGLFGKHHNDIDMIKGWSIDIAGLNICRHFSGKDFSYKVTLPLVCIVYWVVSQFSSLLWPKRKAYSWLKWKLQAELSAASTITRNIKVQQTMTKERI